MAINSLSEQYEMICDYKFIMGSRTEIHLIANSLFNNLGCLFIVIVSIILSHTVRNSATPSYSTSAILYFAFQISPQVSQAKLTGSTSAGELLPGEV